MSGWVRVTGILLLGCAIIDHGAFAADGKSNGDGWQTLSAGRVSPFVTRSIRPQYQNFSESVRRSGAMLANGQIAEQTENEEKRKTAQNGQAPQQPTPQQLRDAGADWIIRANPGLKIPENWPYTHQNLPNSQTVPQDGQQAPQKRVPRQLAPRQLAPQQQAPQQPMPQQAPQQPIQLPIQQQPVPQQVPQQQYYQGSPPVAPQMFGPLPQDQFWQDPAQQGPVFYSPEQQILSQTNSIQSAPQQAGPKIAQAQFLRGGADLSQGADNMIVEGPALQGAVIENEISQAPVVYGPMQGPVQAPIQDPVEGYIPQDYVAQNHAPQQQIMPAQTLPVQNVAMHGEQSSGEQLWIWNGDGSNFDPNNPPQPSQLMITDAGWDMRAGVMDSQTVIDAAYHSVGKSEYEQNGIFRLSDALHNWRMRKAEGEIEMPLSMQLTQANNWGLRFDDGTMASRSLLSAGGQINSQNWQVAGFVRGTLDRSDALSASLYDARAAQMGAATALMDMLPTLRVNTTHSDTRWGAGSKSVLNSNSRFSASLDAEWTIYAGGANTARYRSAKYNAKAAEYQYLAAERQLVLDSLEAYLQLYSAQRLVTAIAGSHMRLSRIRDITVKLFHSGYATQTEIAQIEAEIEASAAELARAKASRDQQAIAYSDYTGNDIPDGLQLPAIDHLVPNDRETALSRALQDNFTIKRANYRVMAARENTKTALGQAGPQVRLFASANTYHKDWVPGSLGDLYDNREMTLGARLSIPLVEPAKMASYKRSRHSEFAEIYRARDTIRRISVEIKSSWAAFQSQRGQSLALSRKLEKIRKVRDGANAEYEAGLRPISDVVRREIEYANAQIEFDRSRSDEILAAYRIAVHFPDLTLLQF